MRETDSEPVEPTPERQDARKDWDSPRFTEHEIAADTKGTTGLGADAGFYS